jgi:hypothetical protein
MNVNPFLGLTIAREVFYSLSFGLRYLFLWGFVALSPVGRSDKDDKLHSGSWDRWGITGMILKWFLLLATLAMTLMQVIYRLYAPLRQVNAFYEAEGALESCVSAIFMLKLLLNVYLAALDTFGAMSHIRLLLRYTPIMVALLISLGIGVGNVIQCKYINFLSRFCYSHNISTFLRDDRGAVPSRN